MRYFSYGSNMDPDQMAHRCPGAHVITTGILEHHRLDFVRDPAIFDGGVATIIDAIGESVHGVVWEIDDSHLASLDEWEAYPLGYDRFEITLADGSTALVYQANSTEPEAPEERYLEGILRGARFHGLPEEYIDSIQRRALL
ncbi:MAG: gamma-glutamylcyclotransferase family protein [Actinomycetota bacterium]